uniref:Aminoacyl-transfer RNA synthetases class-II family profile domain-containing protein n=1 Tax=Globodera rostochiensis TaxID=31243 RepID=A0A914HAH1_GLORO
MALNSVRSVICSSARTVGACTKFAELVNELKPRENVLIQGWVQRSQTYREKMFLKLNDGSSCHQIQAVVPRNVCKTLWVGSAIRAWNLWQMNVYLLANRLKHDIMRQMPHLRPKSKAFSAILRLRSHLTHLTHRFFDTASFSYVDMPMISQNDCEGAGEAFSIISGAKKDFFGSGVEQFLQVSAQLHLEAVASAIPRVYTLGPVFRADPGVGRSNMAEFRMLEVECAFMDSLEQLCAFVEDFLKFVVQKTLEDERSVNEFREYCTATISADGGEQKQSAISNSKTPHKKILIDFLAELLERPLPRVPFEEALKVVSRPGDDRLTPLNRREEFALVDAFNGPLFVMHFPAKQKPFYTRRSSGSYNDEQGQQNETTESFDLLVPQVGELAGGSVREWEVDKLVERLPPDSKLDWYVELRNRGYPRTAGFGLGMDRLMQALFGIPNIRDTIAFPRWCGHMRC